MAKSLGAFVFAQRTPTTLSCWLGTSATTFHPNFAVDAWPSERAGCSCRLPGPMVSLAFGSPAIPAILHLASRASGSALGSSTSSPSRGPVTCTQTESARNADTCSLFDARLSSRAAQSPNTKIIPNLLIPSYFPALPSPSPTPFFTLSPVSSGRMQQPNNTVIDHAAHGCLGAGAKTPEGLAAHERSYYRAWNALAKMRGGPKALAAINWPESPIETVQSEPTQPIKPETRGSTSDFTPKE